FFFSSRRRHTRSKRDWSSDVCSSDLHQTLLSGMGDTHLSIVTERLSRKFGVEVDTEEVRVPYRETITRPAEAEGKYKKQTGGHRSEERRVGKECRAWRAQEVKKKRSV